MRVVNRGMGCLFFVFFLSRCFQVIWFGAQGAASHLVFPAAAGHQLLFDVTVGPGFAFVPSMLTISAGDTVRWTWVSDAHSVTSGIQCTADGRFCSPDNTNCAAGILSDTGAVYEHTFAQPGTYSYFCDAHCKFGVTGVINVARPRPTPRPRPTLPQYINQ